jgi:hypothetical protein
MTIPVLQIEGGYRRCSNLELVYKTGSPQDPPSYVVTLLDQGYSDEERAEYGLFLAVDFTLPEGYEVIGAEYFELVEGVVRQLYPIQLIPPPPVLTDYEKLANLLAFVALTPEQLKAVLEAIE